MRTITQLSQFALLLSLLCLIAKPVKGQSKQDSFERPGFSRWQPNPEPLTLSFTVSYTHLTLPTICSV